MRNLRFARERWNTSVPACSCRWSLVAGRCRRGTALVEAVLALPLLAVILGLTWWVGWAMTNQQRVKAASHYAAWRGAYSGAPSSASLERVEFAGKGEVRNYTRSAGAAGTVNNLVDAAGLVSSGAAMVADQGPRLRFPRGSSIWLSGEFPTSVGLWNRYQGDIRGRAAREGVSWRYAQTNLRDAMVDIYFPHMESCMIGVPPPGGNMAMMVRQLYLYGW